MITIPLMHLDACTLNTLPGDDVRISRLASVTRYGPNYSYVLTAARLCGQA